MIADQHTATQIARIEDEWAEPCLGCGEEYTRCNCPVCEWCGAPADLEAYRLCAECQADEEWDFRRKSEKEAGL